MTRGGFLLGLLLGLGALAALVVYQRFFAFCPCGFEFDPLTGGCRVVLGPVPCGGPGGVTPNTPTQGGSNSGGPGSMAAGIPPQHICPHNLFNCGISPDWKTGLFEIRVTSGGMVPTGPVVPGPHIKVVGLSLRDNNNASCFSAAGTIHTPQLPFQHKLPLDASLVSGFPDMTVHANENCVPRIMRMKAFPVSEPDCGCDVTFLRAGS